MALVIRIMKILLIIMILLSIVVGIPTNLGYLSLFGIEFSGPISEIKAGTFLTYRLIHWIVLLCTHILFISLLFIKQDRNFSTYFFWFTLLFIIVFVLFDFFALFYLIPFILVWFIALIKLSKSNHLRN